jgi:hypothetical protein
VIYQLLADGVLLLHLLFILFVLLGGLLVIRWKWIAWVHLPAAIWGTGIEIIGWPCPLTSLENYLLNESSSSTYGDGFISHYLLPIIYPDGLTENIQIILGVIVIVTNLVVYSFVWQRHRVNR